MLPYIKVMLISDLLGNETAEKVLLYLQNYETGYARRMATVFAIPVSQVQRQLERFELAGVLVSHLIGKTRQYQFNPRYLFKTELKALLGSVLRQLPQNIIDQYFTERTRPRRKGKAL